MPRFLLSYRVPKGYQPGEETGQAWQGWFNSLGPSLAELGNAVIATRTLGNLGDDTRIGGYSVITAGDMEEAARLAAGCPAIPVGGGLEIGAVPEFPPLARPEAG